MRGGRLWLPRAAILLLAGLFLAALPPDGGPSGTVRTAGAYAPGTAGQPLRVMPLGASSTEGIGNPATAGYRLPLYTALTADGVHVNYVGSQQGGPSALPDRDHEGHAGWTLQQMIPHVRGWVAAADPDVVLLHMGTNDVWSGSTAAVAVQRLDTLLGEVFEAAPRAHVVVAGIWAPLPQLKAAKAEFAQRGAQVVLGYAGEGRSVEFVDTSALLSPADLTDTLHANSGGYAKIAAMWTARVETWLAREGVTS